MRIFITIILGLFLINIQAQLPENDLEQRVIKLEQEMVELKQQVEKLAEKLGNTTVVAAKPDSAAEVISQPQLILEKWYYHTVRVKINTYYAIDVELRNNYAKAIEEIDARVDFKNLLGGHLYSINVTAMLKIPPGQTVVDLGSEANKRLLGKEHQMTRLSPHEVKVELVIRKIVFEDGTLLNF